MPEKRPWADPAQISTSYAERQNLTMRMAMRRFTRLTNAFSKNVANHEAAVALDFMHYNFVRIHQTLRVTPAMAASVTDRLWSIEDSRRSWTSLQTLVRPELCQSLCRLDSAIRHLPIVTGASFQGFSITS